MSKKITPNYGYAVLKPKEEGEQMNGGIVIPDMGQEKGRLAIVDSISPIYNFNLGEFAPTIYKVGDLVVFPPMGGQKVTLDGDDYIIVSITDLAAKIEE